MRTSYLWVLLLQFVRLSLLEKQRVEEDKDGNTQRHLQNTIPLDKDTLDFYYPPYEGPLRSHDLLPLKVHVPLGGNAFITASSPGAVEMISEEGLGNWADPRTLISVYFHMSQLGRFHLSLRLKVPNRGQSLLRVSIGETQTLRVRVKGSHYHVSSVGTFLCTIPGYVRVDFHGIQRSSFIFADISHLILSLERPFNFGMTSLTSPEEEAQRILRFVSDETDFHFGRRGPSIHLRFDQSSDLSNCCEFYYNEVMVPQGQDVLGSFYAVIGFQNGYFGLQVNGPSQRTIIFSLWADPQEEIFGRPKLIEKGPQVTIENFEHEGSGKKGVLEYNWTSGITYKFLIFGSPINPDAKRANGFEVAGWVWSPNEPMSGWNLIAKFQFDSSSEMTQLSAFHSFSENFKPSTGHVPRGARFGNQWVRDYGGNWLEMTRGIVTGDFVAKNCRLDFSACLEDGLFYLKNCGFFNSRARLHERIYRSPGNRTPEIDFAQLGIRTLTSKLRESQENCSSTKAGSIMPQCQTHYSLIWSILFVQIILESTLLFR